MATHSSTLAWKIPWTEEPGRLQSMGSDMTEWLHFHFTLSCIGEGNGNPLQCSCLENPRDRGAWWGHTESDILKRLSSSDNNVFLLGFSLSRTLHFLDLVEYFLSHVKEFFSNYLIKYFLRSFLSLFSPGTPKMQMLACLILSQRSLRLSSSFYFIFLVCLLFLYSVSRTEYEQKYGQNRTKSCDFHHSTFQVTYLFFCLTYSGVDFF